MKSFVIFPLVFKKCISNGILLKISVKFQRRSKWKKENGEEKEEEKKGKYPHMIILHVLCFNPIQNKEIAKKTKEKRNKKQKDEKKRKGILICKWKGGERKRERENEKLGKKIKLSKKRKKYANIRKERDKKYEGGTTTMKNVKLSQF